MLKTKARNNIELEIFDVLGKSQRPRQQIIERLKGKWPVRTVDYHLAVMYRRGSVSVSKQGKTRGLYATTSSGRKAHYELIKLRDQERAAKDNEETKEFKRRLYLHGLKIDPIPGPGKTVVLLKIHVPESVPDVNDMRRYLYHRLVEREELDTLEIVILQALREWSLAWPEPATLQV